MARQFSLAALLRLRHIEQDTAAGRLSAANSRLRDNQARRARTRAELGATPSHPADSLSLNAVAAARAAARGMLADLQDLERIEIDAVGSARRSLDAARTKSISLEKLADRHAVAVTAEDLRAEQSVIDELASTSWHRAREGRAV